MTLSKNIERIVLDLDRPIDPSQLQAAGAPQQPSVRCPSCGAPGVMP
jgi:hypothetical protein